MKILMVGALPPPRHGLSMANAKFLERAVASHNVKAHDATGHRGDPAAVGRFAWSKALGFLRTYRGLLDLPGCDAVYLTPGQTFWGVLKMAPFFWASRIGGKPAVFHLHGGALGEQYAALKGWRRRLFRSAVSSSRRAIVLSPCLRSTFAGLLPPERVDVVPNFAAAECFGVTPSWPEAFTAQTPLRVLFLSNLIPTKGFPPLVQAVAALRAEGFPVELDLAGHATPEVAASLQTALQDSGLRWHGPVDSERRLELLAASHLFALPTTYPMEGQPLSILEAMAARLAVLTTRHAAIPEIFGPVAPFYAEATVPALRAALQQALSSPAALRDQGEAHHQHALQEFREEVFVERILRSLSNQKP